MCQASCACADTGVDTYRPIATCSGRSRASNVVLPDVVPSVDQLYSASPSGRRVLLRSVIPQSTAWRSQRLTHCSRTCCVGRQAVLDTLLGRDSAGTYTWVDAPAVKHNTTITLAVIPDAIQNTQPQQNGCPCQFHNMTGAPAANHIITC
jgi:hypothetical protein